MNLLEKIEEYIEKAKLLDHKDNMVRNEIIQIMHDHYEGDLLQSFLYIDQLNKKRLKKERQILYGGLEDGMHELSSISKKIMEGDIKKAKQEINLYFTSDNIAFLIRIAIAYFPKGEYQSCSLIGRWFFDSFKSMLQEHKGRYLEGGDSFEWAKHHGYFDYIKLILSK
jgi:hypothetical protein